MGSTAKLPEWEDSDVEKSDQRLGEVLSGRLASVDIDSVAAVQDIRERR